MGVVSTIFLALGFGGILKIGSKNSIDSENFTVEIV